MPTISKSKLNNTFIDELPADLNEVNTPRQVEKACYSFVQPAVPSNPSLIHVSDEMATELGLEDVKSPDFLNVVTGKLSLPNSRPYAMCYGGHQFGHWAGQLGDGRAINIGEIEFNSNRWALQLKGSGRTPYSRGADGNAVLRSSIREYLCSEAMHHLGVPTTRALSLALSGDQVMRDMLYDGHPAEEKGAIVCRVAPSFIRFGNFEIFASRGDHETLKTLVDYTIRHFYPELGSPSKETYIAFFREVMLRTKKMLLDWQRVGFVHGVMNTDNLSILGLTIDYGPYGWLESYEPDWTPNITDAEHRRYRYENQPSIGLWNLTQLANALFPLVKEAPALEAVLEEYRSGFPAEYLEMMLSKLGILKKNDNDQALVKELQVLMMVSQIDMTLFFRQLNVFDSENPMVLISTISATSYLTSEEFKTYQDRWEKWLRLYSDRLSVETISSEERIERMNTINPKYVLRNYMAQLAIDDADKGNYQLIDELYKLLKNPYDEQPEMEKWFVKRPDWAKDKIGSSMLSCSS